MRTLKKVPKGLEEIIERYGNPDEEGDGVLDADFVKDYLMVGTAPFPLRISWKKDTFTRRVYGHALVVPVIVDALKEIMNFGGAAYLADNGYDEWGGCFNFRPARGNTKLSTHSWGIAVDYCPSLGPWGGVNRVPQFILDAFEKRGFVNGRNWKPSDGMHFQACSGY